MLRTKAYSELVSLDQPNCQGKVRHFLNMMTNNMKLLLARLYDQRWITAFQYQQMDIQRSIVRLDHIFFLPDTHQQEQLLFEPKTISTLSPLMPMNRYLYRLLAPIYYNQVAHLMTIDKGSDLIPRLELYQQQGHLQSTTYLITLHLKDIYTSIRHTQLLQSLRSFLDDFLNEETIEGMTISAILELTKFLLNHQYFIYQRRIYQQTIGGGTGLYFIDLLIDIYLFYWQQPLVLNQNQHEIYVRHFNNLFLTWNESKEKFHHCLTTMNYKHSFLQYDVNIQTNEIHYLDVDIHQCLQTFHTHVYHDWQYEPYILPNLHQDPSFLTPVHTLRMALIRAVLCCSQLQDFEDEQQYIEYSFLFHRFSFDFIRKEIKGFFLDFNIFDLSIYHNQVTYDEIRRHVRQWDRQKREEKRKHLDEGQKQCIWYIYSKLKGVALYDAQQNPIQFLPPSSQNDPSSLDGIKIEVIGLPKYPSDTI
ncbi:unnamed protein product [Rotaria sp. Silwood2]|nr:unnamed protein product [Rotaria sp. Silwood2]CAF4741035.1 unnamed protein product [Rotaria sp. Silwood2]